MANTVTWQEHDPVGSNKLQVLVYNGNSYELVDKQARAQIDVIGSVLDTDATGIIAKIKKIEDELNGAPAASSWVTRLDDIDTNKANVITVTTHPSYRGGGINVGIDLSSGSTKPVSVTIDTNTYNPATHAWENTNNVALVKDIVSMVEDKIHAIPEFSFSGSGENGGITVSIDTTSDEPVIVSVAGNTYNPATSNWTTLDNVTTAREITGMVDNKLGNLLYEDYDDENFVLDIGGHAGYPPESEPVVATTTAPPNN